LQEALSDGEDFELLMSFSPEKKDFLQKASFPLYKIGIFTNEVDSLVVDYGDKKEDLDLYGYSHG
jgi:thiamine monophosphate kinase